MKLKIVTSSEILFEGETKQISIPGGMGRMGVLPKHAGMISTLEVGDVKIINTQDNEQHIFISGGIVKVLKDSVLILADEADKADDLVKEQIEEAIKKAEEKLSSDILPEELIRIEKELQYQKFKRKQLGY